MALHVIVGSGAIGSGTAELLLAQGHDVRVVTRSGTARVAGAQSVRADASDAAALTRATEGAAVLYNCANPPYDQWSAQWPPLSASLLTTAERTGAVLVTMGNLYVYGPVDVPMTEALPDAATDVKGRIRARMWREARELHEAGRIRATEARASDFYGPGVLSTGHLADRVVPALLRGRRPQVIGDPDTVHSFTYVRDVARALVRLGGEERAWGRAWHVPSAPPMSRRQAVAGLAAAAGVPVPEVSSLPWPVLRAVGVVQKPALELWKMRYQWQRTYVIDSSAYEAEFGETATPVEQGFAETVAWWRERLAAGRAA
ncbi:nucleoside-diphosphate-sugar epimerase [Motilibacter peucedani]|uniref:Nucleoside-diphosphate-sugar epimerase n=1 Tax=Motilibacter peucedani TaxID=598650 RepID=A0A420XRN4_9ACTN|nr:NAD-dependent epimerase/dehydratase family protein [Motilibacter peucedani]RKS77524.1 nucleoside-diphosphate-sugar epimerase [Motilibacter peucedani]